MRELTSAWKPGGRIAFHLIDRDFLKRNFKTVSWKDEQDLFSAEVRQYDRKAKVAKTIFILIDQKTGQGEASPTYTRLYTKNEMVTLMRKCGLRRIQVFGDFQGNPYKRFSSIRPVYLAEKP